MDPVDAFIAIFTILLLYALTDIASNMAVIIFIIIFLFIIYWKWKRKSFWNRLGIPEVPGLPGVGNLLPVILKEKTYFENILDLYKKGEGKKYIGIYNSISPALLIRDPDLIDIMLRLEGRNFEDRGLFSSASDPLSWNLFFLKGKLWKWTRAKLRPAFSNERLKTAYKGIKISINECLASLGSGVDLRQAMDNFSCNVIAKSVFCVSDNTGFVENAQKVFSLSGLKGLSVFLRLFTPRLALSLGIKTVPKDVEHFFRRAISQAQRVEGSFLDLMLYLKETEIDFHDDLMVSQFFIFILAGFETTSSALTSALYLLSKNPEVQKKVRSEIESVFKEHGNTFDSLKKLTYLDWVINETLRLYPPVTGLLRLAEEPFKLPCGATLPAGTGVSIQFYALHRDPRFYENPLMFIPERWEKPNRVFYPFGLGSRLCIGMKFALLEMKSFLSAVLLKFNIKLNSATIEPLSFDPTSFMFKTKTPIFIDFEKI